MNKSISTYLYDQLTNRRPNALADISGSAQHPNIRGLVYFVQTPVGVLTTAEIGGLPINPATGCNYPVYALHIHSGGSCTGTSDNPFADAQGHFNPNSCSHPYHAGDLPPLFSSRGFAWYTFLSTRFQVEDIIGRTVIVHNHPDDFTTQPSGNPGSMIACGVIRRV